MTLIADSNAVFDPDRVLPPHQSALTILQNILAAPDVAQVRWLDLASGRGQILVHLKDNLSDGFRAKLQFVGYDIDVRYSQQAERVARQMSMGRCDFATGELSRFHRDERTEGKWDFITLTNTVHEISPGSLGTILFNAVVRLSTSGSLFIYDMDRLSTPELGAVLWTGPEFARILTTLFNALGCKGYEPAVGSWRHRSCNGWSAQVNSAHLRLPEGVGDRAENVIQVTAKCISKILDEKMEQTREGLDFLTRFPPETGKENADRIKLLYDFWAITRAIEVNR